MISATNTSSESRAGDLWGGLAAMLVALPSAIAFGVLIYSAIGPGYAGEGALAGILGAAALGIVAPLVSRNGGFITAPCAPAAAVMSALAAELATSGQLTVERITMLLALTALLSALLQVLYGLLRAGRLIKFIPYQVVSGYLSGVAVIIVLGQLPKLLGLPKTVSLDQGLLSPALWNWTGITVGMVTIVVMVVAPRLTQKVPGAILGLLAGIVAYFVLAFFNRDLLQLDRNALVIGPIEASGSLVEAVAASISSLALVRPADIGMIFISALTLSVLLSIDTLITVVGVAQIGLIAASVVGICLTILLFIRDQIHGSVLVSKADLHSARSKRRRRAAEAAILEQHGGEAAVAQLRGNLFFGTTDQLFSELEQDLATRRYLLLDLRRVQSMDFTAAHLFEQMREQLSERHGELLFSGMPSSLPTHQDIEHYMKQLGLESSREGIRIFDTRDSALEWMEERILEAAGWIAAEEEQLLNLGDIEIFSKLDAATITGLASVVREMSLPAHSRLCSRGDTGDEIFFVRRGRLQALLPLEGGKRHHLATFCQGDFLGEMAFLDRQPRSADIDTVTVTDLYALSREHFDGLVKTSPALGGRVFEQLAYAVSKRLRIADTELRALEER